MGGVRGHKVVKYNEKNTIRKILKIDILLLKNQERIILEDNSFVPLLVQKLPVPPAELRICFHPCIQDPPRSDLSSLSSLVTSPYTTTMGLSATSTSCLFIQSLFRNHFSPGVFLS